MHLDNGTLFDPLNAPRWTVEYVKFALGLTAQWCMAIQRQDATPMDVDDMSPIMAVRPAAPTTAPISLKVRASIHGVERSEVTLPNIDLARTTTTAFKKIARRALEIAEGTRCIFLSYGRALAEDDTMLAALNIQDGDVIQLIVPRTPPTTTST